MASSILAEAEINIWGSVTNDSAEFGIIRMVVSDPEMAQEKLTEAGYMCRLSNVLGVEVADCWSNRFLFPGSIRREEVDCLAADLGRKLNGKNNEGHGTGAGSFRSGRLASEA